MSSLPSISRASSSDDDASLPRLPRGHRQRLLTKIVSFCRRRFIRGKGTALVAEPQATAPEDFIGHPSEQLCEYCQEQIERPVQVSPGNTLQRPSEQCIERLSRPFLDFPPELRNMIYGTMLRQKGPDRLLFHCFHERDTIFHNDSACSHSDDPEEAKACGHRVACHRPPESGFTKHSRAFSGLSRTNRQVSAETAYLVNSADTIVFAGLDDLRCYHALLCRRHPTQHHSFERTFGWRLGDVKNVEVGLIMETEDEVAKVAQELMKFPALEHIELHVLARELRSLHAEQIRVLTRARELPRLRSCKIVISVGAHCDVCSFTPCPVWDLIVQGQKELAEQTNELIVKDLQRRVRVPCLAAVSELTQ